MSRRQHFLEADDRAREQNLRFVRNPDDDFQQFFGGSGGNVSTPPRDYKVVTPKPGTSRGNNMNALDDRAQFFCQLGLPKYEAYDWAERSLKNASFNLDYFRNRSVDLRESNINIHVLEEIKNAFRQPLDNNFSNQRLKYNVPTKLENFYQNFSESPKRSRSRSPSNYMNWGNSQQQKLNFSSSMEYNHGFNKNDLRMGNLSYQNWQSMSSSNSRSMSQSLFGNNSLNTSFNNFIGLAQTNNGNRVNNQSQLQSNRQSFNNQFQPFKNNNYGPTFDTFNQNNWQSNDQQSQQFNMGSMQPWSRGNEKNSKNSSNSYNYQDFGQFSSNDQIFSRRSNQSFQHPQNVPQQIQHTSDILSLLQNPNFQKFVQKAEQFQQFPQGNNVQDIQRRNVNSNIAKPHVLRSNAARSNQNLRGPKRENLKNRPLNNRQKTNMKNLKDKNFFNNNNQIFNKQITKFAPKTGMIQKDIDIKIPKSKMAMPSRKNWINWWKGNIWVEKKVMSVDDQDPEIINTFSIKKNEQPKELMNRLIECREKMTSLLKKSRETQTCQDAYGFMKCKIMLYKLLFEYKGRGIVQHERKACENLIKQITVVDMIICYKALIRKWRASYVTTNSDQAQPRFSLGKLISQKVFHWLVRLAFKELKRISNPILNPPKKSEQLRELHELSNQLHADKKHMMSRFDPSKGTAKEFVRSSIEQVKEYLEKAEKITVASSKKLVMTRIRLMDTELDKNLNAELKKEKDDLLVKLKVNPYAKQNYEHLINEAIKMSEIVSNLQNADPRLILQCEKEKRVEAKKFITHSELKVAINYLLDERLAEYGGYLKEVEATKESERSYVFLFDEFFENKRDGEECNEDPTPIEVPQTKEDQYKELYKFSSGYNLKKIQRIFFYEPSRGSPEDFVRTTVNFIKIYLEKPVPIRTGICKRFVVAKIRLSDNSVDDKISESLKKEKYALLDKLKKDSHAQKNYEHLIEYALVMRMRYLHLRSMDRKLLKDSEKEEILIYQKVSKNFELKFMCKHLLDERLAETGTYLTAADIAEEKTKKTKSDDKIVTLTKETLHEVNDTKQFEEQSNDGDEQNGDEHFDVDEQDGQNDDEEVDGEGCDEHCEDDEEVGDEDDDVQYVENEQNEDEEMSEDQ